MRPIVEMFTSQFFLSSFCIDLNISLACAPARGDADERNRSLFRVLLTGPATGTAQCQRMNRDCLKDCRERRRSEICVESFIRSMLTSGCALVPRLSAKVRVDDCTETSCLCCGARHKI
jgi:hypothetical protein